MSQQDLNGYRESTNSYNTTDQSPPQLPGKPDFEEFKEQIAKIVYAFQTQGAYGWAPNPDIDWEYRWAQYLEDGILPERGRHHLDWKEKYPLEKIYRDYVIPLQEENARLKSLLIKNDGA